MKYNMYDVLDITPGIQKELVNIIIDWDTAFEVILKI